MEKPDRPADPPRPHQRTTLRIDARNHQKSRSVDQGSGALWSLAEIQTLREDPVANACRIADRGLNEEEWQRFVPELPYTETCPA